MSRDVHASDTDRQVEAAIMASRRPVPVDTLRRFLPEGFDLDASLDRISSFWTGRAARLVRTRDTVRVVVDHSLLPPPRTARTRDLSEAAIATLAVIVIHQPVSFRRIEEIRRRKLARSLVDDLEKAGLVEGRRRTTGSGKALEYFVTERFLEEVGIATVLDFPTSEEALSLGFRSWSDPGEAEDVGPGVATS